jgi:hypothetical protein
MQDTDESTDLIERMTYLVADRTIVVEAHDSWSARMIEELFARWYLSPVSESEATSVAAAIIIRSGVPSPRIPRTWPQFKIAGGGICFTDGKSSYIEIGNSVIVLGNPEQAVEVWSDGTLDLPSEALTRLVSYALAAALRRAFLFELHSAAVVDPESGQGVLIIGPSGCGKSSLTVQLATAGWSFLTDDVLVLGRSGVEVKAWPVRRCFAITEDTISASHFLSAHTVLDYSPVQADAKKRFMPHHVFDAAFNGECIPRKLFFSELTGGNHSQVLRLSASETMARLIRMNPWSCYDRTTAATHLAMLAALVKQSTGYALLAGKDLLDPATSVKLIAGYTRA